MFLHWKDIYERVIKGLFVFEMFSSLYCAKKLFFYLLIDLMSTARCVVQSTTYTSNKVVLVKDT